MRSALGHSRPKWAVLAMSGLPPLATELRTSLEVRLVPKPEVGELTLSLRRHARVALQEV